MIQPKQEYNAIYIVDSQQWWEVIQSDIDEKHDLVLTFDLGMVKFLEALDIDVFYLDHLISNEKMEANNYIIYEFFKNWHYDKGGKDLFVYKDIPFGFSLRLEIWNDFTAYTRIYRSLKILRSIQKKVVYVGSVESNIISILKDINIDFISLSNEKKIMTPTFYFPISQWMDEQIRPKGLRFYKRLLVEKVTLVFMAGMNIFDHVFSRNKKTVFIQEYHPTREIIKHLKKDKSLKVLLSSIARRQNYVEVFSERFVPMYGDKKQYHRHATILLEKFKTHRFAKLILEDGSDISDAMYNIITDRLELRLGASIRTLDSCIVYVEKNNIDLLILIANIGHIPTLLHCVTQTKNIPTYLIINGLLGPQYSDESKYATFINGYSKSIKDNYFKGMHNIYTLGDPRMDMYPQIKQKYIDRESPTITIGAGGFNNVDLNSYVAVEFDFMYDVLQMIRLFSKEFTEISVIIKVRPNGYKQQYQDFVHAYFPDLVDEIIDTTPMKEVLQKSDLYISIESQTLFEASCLGIPVIYYKKATEFKADPFNNQSELVTANNTQELLEAFYDFRNNTPRYEAFLKRSIMEKYVGYLDGENVDRNVKFIYELLQNIKG